MQGKYAASLAMQHMMSMLSSMTFMTADQMRMAALFTPPIVNMALGYYDRNPVTWRIEGVRQLFAAHPIFNKIASRAPDVINIQYGLGETPQMSRSFREVTLMLSAAKPYRNMEALGYVTNLQTHSHPKADFHDLIKRAQIDTVLEGDDEDLLRFQPEESNGKAPKYLIAPRSGHYSTLIAAAIQNYVDAGYTVYVNDIKNAAYTPQNETPHDMNHQVKDKRDGLAKIFEIEGQRVDLIAICQGAIPSTIATATLCEEKVPHRPKSFGFLSGPGDINVTKSIVNEFGEEVSDFVYSRFATSTAPNGKKVRAGHAQVGDFMIGNPGRHMNDLTTIMNFIAHTGPKWAHQTPMEQRDILMHLENGELDVLEKGFLENVLFRTEYMTSADMDAASYGDALYLNFKDNFLAAGTATYFGKPVDLKAIDIPCLTGDATNDDISTIGQSMGLLAHLRNDIIKSSLIIPNKGHFWWGGNTAREKQWPQIMAWQDDPQNSDVPDFRIEMLDEARTIHAQNIALEEAELKESLPFGVKLEHLGVSYPFTIPVNIPSAGNDRKPAPALAAA